MNLTTEKGVTHALLAVAITVIGFAAAPIARAESPVGEIQPPVSEAEAGSGETVEAVAPAVLPAGVTTAPIASDAPPAGEIKRPAQTKSEIEVGIGKTSSDSFKFGDYRGLESSKAHVIANIKMTRRGEDNARYLEIIGRNLGLDSRNVRIMGGEQGNYGLRFEYDELTKLRSDSYETPYLGAGTTILTQPATVTDGADPASMAGLAANMKRFNVETQRKAAELGLTKQLPGGWDVAASFKREKKDGTKLTGAPMQIGTGGSRGTMLVPEPINYTTDQFEVLAHYAAEKLQLQAGYYGSLFSNANKSLTWDNLYTGSGNTTGRLGQMPDNQLHQLNATGGYTISNATRLTGSLSFGRMTQNEAFLPYSTGGAMPATTSLNGKIDTTHADIKLNSKLTRDLNVTAGYKYDDRDNRTPVNQYSYIPADRDSGGVGASNVRQNTPLSNTKQVAYVDMDYHLTAATKLKLGYGYEKVTHTYEPTAGDKESTVKAEVKHSFSDTASAGLAYAHSDRKASPYVGADALMGTYTATYLASLCVAPNTFLYNGVSTACTGAASLTSQATTPFLDTPAVRKFFLADRKRDKLRAFANIAPGEKLDLQLGASYYNEKYPDTEAGFGLAKATGWSANLDANLAATDTVSGTFFTTLDVYKTVQNGHNGASSATVPEITTLDRQNNTAAFDPLTGVVTRNDRSLTMGLGLRVKPGGNFEWGGDLTHATTTGSTGFSNIGARLTTILPLPDVVTRISRLELFGKYRLQKDVSINMKYAHEKYTSTDWAWDGQTPTSSTTFIGSNQTSPDYSINMINVTLSYIF
ncbi:MAG TPA: MtrB/PioB family decaheme-associated outer membrane protein [Gallionella sp.]